MKGITIQSIAPSSADMRGETYELFKELPGRQVTLYLRRAGALCGAHWHTGSDPSKDPEYFFLVSGRVALYAENKALAEKAQIEVGPYHQLIIEKNIYHEIRALTDIVFLEYRATVFNPAHSDSLSKDEYESFPGR